MGKYAVGRVIARPFVGEYPDFERTPNRHDFSLVPPEKTMLDRVKEAGKSVIAVGKIGDIFAHTGTTEEIPTKGNADGMAKLCCLPKGSLRDFALPILWILICSTATEEIPTVMPRR